MISTTAIHKLLIAAAITIALPALAEEAPPVSAGHEVDTESRIEQLEAQLEAVADELDTLRKTIAVPEDGELKSTHGFGPAASKIYQKDRGLSIGGYGDIRLRAPVGDSESDDSVFDALRAVLYVGYKFNDRILMNSEFEFEHAGTGGGGSVSVEFLNIDFSLIEQANIRGGLLLLPMGFINEIHEPNTYFGAERPMSERQILPSTWRENGAGFFGDFGEHISYRMYAVNGMDATGFSDAGLRGGRQKGGKALANHWAFVGRVDYEPIPGLIAGGSLYTGYSGQNQTDSGTGLDIPDTLTTIYEIHAEYKCKGASLRGLFTQAFLRDTAELNTALGNAPTSGDAVAKRMTGGYVVLGYDVMPWLKEDTRMSLEPFFQYEYLNTQDKMADGFVANSNYKPIPQVVIKLDYRHFDYATGDRDQEVQASIGYVF
jgi:hypothetical protein